MELDIIQNSIQSAPKEDFGPNLIRLKVTNQIKELQTVIHDRNTSRSDFRFYADRLIRVVVEEGLNQLPYQKHSVVAPMGFSYDGLRLKMATVERGNGEGPSRMLSIYLYWKNIDCENEETHQAVEVMYVNFPVDISRRKVLLMSPVLSTGNSIVKSIEILLKYNVKEEKIVVLTLFATPQGIKTILNQFPLVKVVTSELNPFSPMHFGQRYFGTE